MPVVFDLDPSASCTLRINVVPGSSEVRDDGFFALFDDRRQST